MSSVTTLQSTALRHLVHVEGVAAPPAERRRLAELGIRPGAGVQVVHRTAGGGRVVAVAGSRIALDRGTLAAIAVSTEAAPSAAGMEVSA